MAGGRKQKQAPWSLRLYEYEQKTHMKSLNNEVKNPE